MSGTSGLDTAVTSRVGLVIPGSRGLATADGLPRSLLAGAERAGDGLDVLDLDADPAGRDRDGYVLLVGQYGPVPAPAAEDVVTRYAARWAERPVGLVAYGGVSRGRDAAVRLRAVLVELGAEVVDAGLGVNVGQTRVDGGLGVFEQLAWAVVLDAVVAACTSRTASG